MVTSTFTANSCLTMALSGHLAHQANLSGGLITLCDLLPLLLAEDWDDRPKALQAFTRDGSQSNNRQGGTR